MLRIFEDTSSVFYSSVLLKNRSLRKSVFSIALPCFDQILQKLRQTSCLTAMDRRQFTSVRPFRWSVDGWPQMVLAVSDWVCLMPRYQAALSATDGGRLAVSRPAQRFHSPQTGTSCRVSQVVCSSVTEFLQEKEIVIVAVSLCQVVRKGKKKS